MLTWRKNIENKISEGEHIHIIEELPIRKDLWLKNFIKSAISTSLIALAFNFIFTGMQTHNNEQLLVGTIAFLCALLVIFIIDTYHQKVRELELRAIDSNQTIASDYIEEQVDAILQSRIRKMFEDKDN